MSNVRKCPKKKRKAIPYEELISLAAMDYPARKICQEFKEQYDIDYSLEACSKYIQRHKAKINKRKKELQTILDTLPFASKASRVNLLGSSIKKFLLRNDDPKIILEYAKAIREEMKDVEINDSHDGLKALAEALSESAKLLKE